MITPIAPGLVGASAATAAGWMASGVKLPIPPIVLAREDKQNDNGDDRQEGCHLGQRIGFP